MIRYTLSCELSHTFEGWFRNSEDYDRQKGMQLVSCPVCGSEDVEKTLMAPAVSTARSREGRPTEAIVPDVEVQQEAPAAAPAPKPAAKAEQTSALMSLNSEQREILEGLKTLRQKMIEKSDYVGKSFAEEARKIHYGESEERNIYGETTQEDAEALIDEGIAVLPLPQLPEEKN